MGASTLNKKDLFRLHMREVEDDYAVLTRDCEYYKMQTESLQGDNTKLRELVRKWYPHMVRRVGKDALAQWGELDVLRELGIEVKE